MVVSEIDILFIQVLLYKEVACLLKKEKERRKNRCAAFFFFVLDRLRLH